MDDAVLVRSVEGLGDLRRDVERLSKRHRAARQALGQRLTGEMFHDEVGRAVVAADVVERADVRVRERGDGAGLPLEAGAAVRIGAQFGREDLDGDRAVEAGVAGLVDLTHAAGADSRLDLVGSEASPGDEAHGHGLRGALYAALSRSCAWPENLASVPEQGGPGGAHDFGQEDYRSSLSPLKPVSENGCFSVHSHTRRTKRNCAVFVSSTRQDPVRFYETGGRARRHPLTLASKHLTRDRTA